MHGLQLATVNYIVYIIRTSGTEYRRICYNYPWMFVYVATMGRVKVGYVSVKRTYRV